MTPAATHVDRKSTPKRSAAISAEASPLSLLKKPRTDIAADLPLPPPPPSQRDDRSESDGDSGDNGYLASAKTVPLSTAVAEAAASSNRRSLAEEEEENSRGDDRQRRRCLPPSPSYIADQAAGGHDEGERSNAENDKNRRNKNVSSFLEVRRL